MEQDTPSRTPTGHAARLLVVDDDVWVLEVVSELFRGRGFRVREATSGQEAARALQECEFDAVVADLNLGGESGLDVLRAARTLRPETVVVLITAFADVSTAIGALREGAYDYLTKPFDLTELSSVVDRGLEQARLAKENQRLVAHLRQANTDLRQHEINLKHEVRNATQRLRKLHALGREITSSLDLYATLQLIVGGAAELLDARGGLLFSVEAASHDFRCQASHGIDMMGAECRDHVFTGGLLGEVMARYPTLRLGPSELDSRRDDPLVRLMRAHGALIARLEVNRRVIGFLVVADRMDGDFTDEDEEQLMLFAMQAANAIGNARIHQKLKELDEIRSDFVAMVSHEIRTPLTAIMGTLDILMDDPASRPQAPELELLEICDANAKRLLTIVNDILDFSRLEASRLRLVLKPVDLSDTIRRTVRDLLPIATEAGVTIDVDTPDELPKVAADEDRIAQVLTNLISNAVKFSPEGKRVSISAHPMDDGVQVCVTDQGCGIAEEDLPKLFRRFTQIDSGVARKSGGTGLGLVISHGLVKGHGGRMWVESDPGDGSKFRFFLPRQPRSLDADDRDGNSEIGPKLLPVWEA